MWAKISLSLSSDSSSAHIAMRSLLPCRAKISGGRGRSHSESPVGLADFNGGGGGGGEGQAIESSSDVSASYSKETVRRRLFIFNAMRGFLSGSAIFLLWKINLSIQRRFAWGWFLRRILYSIFRNCIWTCPLVFEVVLYLRLVFFNWRGRRDPIRRLLFLLTKRTLLCPSLSTP